jgi:DNA-binding NarL/FixJ family response regulator
MNLPTIKIILKIGLATSVVIILFEATTLLFVYKYFKFDYYLSAVALFFLLAGYIISKYNTLNKNEVIIKPDPFLSLTIKEQYILQLIVEGKSNKEIAAMNYVEISTIKTHINNIYTKLGLNNRKEAIVQYKNRFVGIEYSNIHPFST